MDDLDSRSSSSPELVGAGNDDVRSGVDSTHADYGRPLSAIDAAQLAEENNSFGDSDNSVLALNNFHTDARRPRHDLRVHVYELFDRFVPLASDIDDSTQGYAAHNVAHTQTVLSRDLPHLLSEYETQQGQPLIEEDSRPQLENFCQQFPDHAISCDDLVNMIHGLEQARLAALAVSDEEDSGKDSANALEQKEYVESRSSSGRQSRGSASDDDENLEELSSGIVEPQPISQPPSSSTPVKSHEDHARRPEFSRSQSVQADMTMLVPKPRRSIDHRATKLPNAASPSRFRTTSASAAPASEREKKHSLLKKGGGEIDDDGDPDRRNILKGKGNAPPSTWLRPRPQALSSTKKSRRTSDASGSSSQDHGGISEDQDSRSSDLASPLRSEPGVSAHETLRGPSVASYVFPRAVSPSDEAWYTEQEERWEHMSDRERTRSTSSRAASPPPTSLSSSCGPAIVRLGSPSRRNGLRSFSQALKEYLVEEDAGDELTDLQQRYDHLSRVLQEKERSFEDTQSYHESSIAELETRVEELQNRVHTSTRTGDELKQKEQRYLDQIARLENDLATSQRRGETLERLRDLAQQETTAREASIVTLQGKVNDLQERIAALDREETTHLEHERMWDADREQYRQEIERLRKDLRDALSKDVQIESLSLEREGLRARLRELQSEIEEARSRSGFLSNGRGGDSLPGTVSNRLGRELAGALGSIADESSEAVDGLPLSSTMHDGEEEEDKQVDEEGMDDTAPDESIIITTTRRRRIHQRMQRVLTEASVQTAEEADQKGARGVDQLSPPTYDEAATEKVVMARMHPVCEHVLSGRGTADKDSRSITGLFSVLNVFEATTVESSTARYRSLTGELGVRCLLLEKTLVQRNANDYSLDAVVAGAAHASRDSDPVLQPQAIQRTTTVMEELAKVLCHLCPSFVGSSSTPRSLDAVTRLLMIGSGLMVVVGVVLGGVLGGGDGHVHLYGCTGILQEDGMTWLQSNTLPWHGSDLVGWRDAAAAYSVPV